MSHRIYGWNDWITIKCRKTDKKKLKKIYEIWKKKHKINISFHAFINVVIFPNFFKEFFNEKKLDDKKRNERIQQKYEQLLIQRKERNLKYGKRQTNHRQGEIS